MITTDDAAPLSVVDSETRVMRLINTSPIEGMVNHSIARRLERVRALSSFHAARGMEAAGDRGIRRP